MFAVNSTRLAQTPPTTIHIMPRFFTQVAFCALVALPDLFVSSSSAREPWQTALTFDYNTAAEAFANLHAATPDDARITIGYASTLLVKQPRTEANIRAAHDLLRRIRETAPLPSEESVLALYLLARVELDHITPAEPDSARARFEQLRRNYPAHPLADHTAVHLALLDAYPASGADIDAIPAIKTYLASVKTPEAARDLHLLLGSLQLRQLRSPAAALPHFIAARAVGFEQPLRNAETDLTIANLARETDDHVTARRHYAAFLAAAPRDVRASTVRRIMVSLDLFPSSRSDASAP